MPHMFYDVNVRVQPLYTLSVTRVTDIDILAGRYHTYIHNLVHAYRLCSTHFPQIAYLLFRM